MEQCQIWEQLTYGFGSIILLIILGLLGKWIFKLWDKGQDRDELLSRIDARLDGHWDRIKSLEEFVKTLEKKPKKKPI